jgi:hypothetical protein
MEISSNDIVEHHFYAVVSPNGQFFAGFDPKEGKPSFTDEPLDAKLFTNKYEIKLRPQETLVEFTVGLSKENTSLSVPFRPKKRVTPPHKVVAWAAAANA